jgi:hypothetical protein
MRVLFLASCVQRPRLAPLEGSHLGFGYPSYERFNPHILGSSFKPPTLLGFSPSELCSPG